MNINQFNIIIIIKNHFPMNTHTSGQPFAHTHGLGSGAISQPLFGLHMPNVHSFIHSVQFSSKGDNVKILLNGKMWK